MRVSGVTHGGCLLLILSTLALFLRGSKSSTQQQSHLILHSVISLILALPLSLQLSLYLIAYLLIAFFL